MALTLYRWNAACLGLLVLSGYAPAWAALPRRWHRVRRGGRRLDRSDPGLHQGWRSGPGAGHRGAGVPVVAYLMFAKFNEARQGKAEWAEVGVLAIVGAVVLIFASYLLTEAAGVI